MRPLSPLLSMALAIPALLACSSVTGSRPKPTVSFTIDAPLCSSRIAVIFSIDQLDVGKDTFVVHLTPEHTTSRAFTTTAGSHTVQARTDYGHVWPAASVTLAPGDSFTETLPFYCS